MARQPDDWQTAQMFHPGSAITTLDPNNVGGGSRQSQANAAQALAQFRGRVNQYGNDYQNQSGGGGGMSPAEAQLNWNLYQSNLANSTSPSQYVYGAGLQNMLGGLSSMNNLGSSVGNAFDRANMMSSANMQAKYAPYYQYQGVQDTNRTNQEMQSQRLGSQENILSGILPHIISALGSLGGGGVGGFQTNYGAGAQLGSNAQATDSRKLRRNPLLDKLAGMGVGG